MSRENVPHTYGPAKCDRCGHEWVAVWPLGADTLECPNCSGTDTDREQQSTTDVNGGGDGEA